MTKNEWKGSQSVVSVMQYVDLCSVIYLEGFFYVVLSVRLLGHSVPSKEASFRRLGVWKSHLRIRMTVSQMTRNMNDMFMFIPHCLFPFDI